MKKSADSTTNLEPPAPRKGWLVETLENTAEYQKRLQDIQARNAASEARRETLTKNLSTTFFVFFVLAGVFALALGCLALWNAVVG